MNGKSGTGARSPSERRKKSRNSPVQQATLDARSSRTQKLILRERAGGGRFEGKKGANNVGGPSGGGRRKCIFSGRKRKESPCRNTDRPLNSLSREGGKGDLLPRGSDSRRGQIRKRPRSKQRIPKKKKRVMRWHRRARGRKARLILVPNAKKN